MQFSLFPVRRRHSVALCRGCLGHSRKQPSRRSEDSRGDSERAPEDSGQQGAYGGAGERMRLQGRQIQKPRTPVPKRDCRLVRQCYTANAPQNFGSRHQGSETSGQSALGLPDCGQLSVAPSALAPRSSSTCCITYAGCAFSVLLFLPLMWHSALPTSSLLGLCLTSPLRYHHSTHHTRGH